MWKLLAESDDREGALRLIALNVKFKDEVRGVAGELARWIEPSTRDQIAVRLAGLAAVYQLPERSPEGWSTLWAAYIEALAQVPDFAIGLAVVDWNRDGKPFFPKPNELYQGAMAHAHKARMAAYRAKLALGKVEAAPPPKRDKMSREDMIAAGIMDAEGKIIMAKPKGIPPVASRPRESPHELAERLRARATAVPAAEPLAEPGFAGQPFRPTAKPPEPPDELPDVSGEVF